MKNILLFILTFICLLGYSQTPVSWSKLENISYDSGTNTLLKTGTDGWNNAYAISSNAMPVEDGQFFSYTVEDVDVPFIFGLDPSDQLKKYQELDIAIQFQENTLNIYQRGKLFTAIREFKPGIEIKISQKDGRLELLFDNRRAWAFEYNVATELYLHAQLYKANRSISGVLSTFSEKFEVTYETKDASCTEQKDGTIVFDIKGKVNPVTILLNDQQVTENNTSLDPGNYKIRVTNGNGEVFEDKTTIFAELKEKTSNDITFSNGVLTKTSGKNKWDAGFFSANTIVSKGDGSVEYVITENNTNRAFGLSDEDEGSSYLGIDHAFVLMLNNKLYVVENGNIKAIQKYKNGDICKLAKEGGDINYYVNGKLIYSSAAMEVDYFVDVSIKTIGTSMSLKVDFCPDYSDLVVLDLSEWEPGGSVQGSYNGELVDYTGKNIYLSLSGDVDTLQLYVLGENETDNIQINFVVDATGNVTDYWFNEYSSGSWQRAVAERIFFKELGYANGIKFYSEKIEGGFYAESVIGFNLFENYLLSPDNDGQNDALFIEDVSLISFDQYRLTVKTLRGDIIFSTTNPNEKWRCTDSRGNLVSKGTYRCEVSLDETDLSFKFNVEY